MNKKRIGLFLGVEPFGGGMFQHSMNVLDAVCALPDDEYEKVVIASSPHWKNHLKDRDITVTTAPFGIWKNKYFKRLSCVFPSFIWRKISKFVHPICATIHHAKLDACIFPAQDPQTYQVDTPAIGWVHDLMHRYEGHFPEVSANREYERRENHFKKLCHYSTIVVTDSVTGINHVTDSYGTDESKIMDLPYLPPAFLTTTPDVSLDEYNLPEKFFFYPAQFWEHKNHLRLIKALKIVHADHPRASLVLVGSKKAGYEAVKELVKESGLEDAVHFLGYVPDEVMPSLYKKARALIMPTYFGPTNIPPLEAMALGCPVAISGIYGMPTQLGEGALFFNQKDEKDIARRMEKLWTEDDLCENLRQKGFEIMAGKTVDKFNARFEEIVQACIDQSTPEKS
ncbi:MAG: glycosyltransferase family 4 protein [Desulfovibrio sp.]